jgi:hypothetical protein
MSITVEELPDSRQWTTGANLSVEFSYQVRGTASDVDAKNAMLGEAPSSYQYLARQSSQIEPVVMDTANPDGCIWKGTVRYARASQDKEPPETGESTFSFDTGGGTQHVTQSISTVNKYAPAGKTAPDFKGAVGVTHDSVEGVDITVPVYNFSETHYLADSVVTGAYKATLFNLTGKTNNAAWNGFAAGECLFLGASGSKRGDDDWEITFRFAASPNKTGLTVGDITGIDKKGWEYMWVRYADAEDAAAKAIVKKPVAVYIEKVYEEGDFGLLGI